MPSRTFRTSTSRPSHVSTRAPTPSFCRRPMKESRTRCSRQWPAARRSSPSSIRRSPRALETPLSSPPDPRRRPSSTRCERLPETRYCAEISDVADVSVRPNFQGRGMRTRPRPSSTASHLLLTRDCHVPSDGRLRRMSEPHSKALTDVRTFWNARARRYDAHFDEESGDAHALRARMDATLRNVGSGPGHALDAGMGPGRLCEELGRRGWTVWGVDASASMVELARARLPNARERLVVGSIERL